MDFLLPDGSTINFKTKSQCKIGYSLNSGNKIYYRKINGGDRISVGLISYQIPSKDISKLISNFPDLVVIDA